MTDPIASVPLPAAPLSPDLLRRMHGYWRAANYLSVGQIYLRSNPLLDQPLAITDVKTRLLGHWGTTPGLNLLYVHLNRVIVERDLGMILIVGPGHGGPGIVANTYLEGSYTERYPAIERSRGEMDRLFRQFSATSSSTPRAMARCCRSCISTASRSPTRRCSRGSGAMS